MKININKLTSQHI